MIYKEILVNKELEAIYQQHIYFKRVAIDKELGFKYLICLWEEKHSYCSACAANKFASTNSISVQRLET